MRGRKKILLGRPYELLYFIDSLDDSSQAYPFESGLAAVRHLGLVDETNRLQDVGNVIQTANLCFEKLLIVDFAV